MFLKIHQCFIYMCSDSLCTSFLFFSLSLCTENFVKYFINSHVYRFNPLHTSSLCLYPLKTLENLLGFWCFHGVYKETSGMKWLIIFYSIYLLFANNYCFHFHFEFNWIQLYFVWHKLFVRDLFITHDIYNIRDVLLRNIIRDIYKY